VRAREVRASADQLRLMTDAAPIGIFQTDSSNRYIYTNPRWSEITGIPAEAAAGQTWDAMIDAGQGAALAGERDDGAGDPSDPSDLCRRFELGQPDSASQIVLVTSNAVPDSHGGTSGWVGTLADVTTEVGVEAAMSEARDKATEASRLKSDFLANMSHEIRTPMNGVIGMTDLLLETALDTRQRDYAQTVRNSGESLLTILNDILDFSKVEAGKLEVEAIEFDLRAVVYDVVHLFAGAVQSKGLELTSVVESDIPVLVTGDPGRVRQVLTNLISNAIKFTNAGEIVVRASQAAVAGTDADTVIRFEISDTGDGIAHDDLEMVFQPFVQADMSTSRKYGGTGLGLAISGQLVALMGGDCGVSSELGTGSNFWFTLGAHATAAHATQYPPPPDRQPAPTDQQPAPTDQQPAPTDVRAQGPSTSGGPRGGRLLLAEDNLINQKVAVAMLASAGYGVDIVCDGEAAVKAIATGPYDAVLMDCQMPELNGYDATVAIRAREAPGRRTPIIAMTAGARREDRERCMAAGMDGYLAKPVSKDALLALVARFVKDDRSGSAVVPPV
jgi:PAS domain S-box-containing protein